MSYLIILSNTSVGSSHDTSYVSVLCVWTYRQINDGLRSRIFKFKFILYRCEHTLNLAIIFCWFPVNCKLFGFWITCSQPRATLIRIELNSSHFDVYILLLKNVLILPYRTYNYIIGYLIFLVFVFNRYRQNRTANNTVSALWLHVRKHDRHAIWDALRDPVRYIYHTSGVGASQRVHCQSLW